MTPQAPGTQERRGQYFASTWCFFGQWKKFVKREKAEDLLHCLDGRCRKLASYLLSQLDSDPVPAGLGPAMISFTLTTDERKAEGVLHLKFFFKQLRSPWHSCPYERHKTPWKGGFWKLPTCRASPQQDPHTATKAKHVNMLLRCLWKRREVAK